MGLPRTPAVVASDLPGLVSRSALLPRRVFSAMPDPDVFVDGNEMEYFGIKNWAEFQHYKDRNPPWIKLHYEIMTSQDWVGLSDKDRLTMIICMLIASRHDGTVPNDPKYIQRVAYLDSPPNLLPLIESGFLLAGASTCKQMLADASVSVSVLNTSVSVKEEVNTDAILTIALKDGVHHIRQADVDKWRVFYPRLDIMNELRKIAGWNEANVSNRKTRKGINKHINGWLARANDKMPKPVEYPKLEPDPVANGSMTETLQEMAASGNEFAIKVLRGKP